MDSSNSNLHVALLSSPGMGHLIPVIELAKHLVNRHNFTITIYVVASHTSPAEAQVIESATSPKFCDIVELPPVDVSSSIDETMGIVTQLAIMMRESLPALSSAVAAACPRPSVLIVDLFGTEALPIADEFGMVKYVYIATHAWLLALTLYVPVLDKEVDGEYVDQKEALKIPGCSPIRPKDVIDPMLKRTNQQYFEYVRMGVEIPLSDGILVNTWHELQGPTLVALRDENLLGRITKVPVYAVGPITRQSSFGQKNELFDWLDKQPTESVIYVSFGSGGTLSYEQMNEMAWGLELSQQRFVWVVRPPTAKSDAAFFTAGNEHDDLNPLSYLPDGFLARTKDVGQVVLMWAPQVNILSHPSVGGFLSHCGWNSSLESIMNGVPMIAWPLYAEQRMNATMLTEELGVAVRSKALPSEEVIGREEIAMMVRKIMVEEEGFEIRDRTKQLKQSGERAIAKGGSSYEELSQLAKHCETLNLKKQH